MTRSRQTADWGSRAGLAKIVPSSVAVGSGTGSADSLGTVTFSGASSLSLNNCFSSAYDNYRIIGRIEAPSASDISVRFRAAGSDNLTASSYKAYRTYNPYSGPTVANETLTSFYCGYFGADGGGFVLDVLSPNLAKRTNFNWMGGDANYAQFGIGIHTVASSFDGFTIFGPTITGTISVYGYTK